MHACFHQLGALHAYLLRIGVLIAERSITGSSTQMAGNRQPKVVKANEMRV